MLVARVQVIPRMCTGPAKWGAATTLGLTPFSAAPTNKLLRYADDDYVHPDHDFGLRWYQLNAGSSVFANTGTVANISLVCVVKEPETRQTIPVLRLQRHHRRRCNDVFMYTSVHTLVFARVLPLLRVDSLQFCTCHGDTYMYI